MRRVVVPALLGLVLVACSSSGPDPASGPPAFANYHGDLVPADGVTGWVSFKTSASGEVVDPLVMLQMRDYDCGGGVRLSSEQGQAPIGVTIPVIDGSFEYASSVMAWRGTFTSDSAATGTVEGNLVHPDCDFGPLAWSAELTSVEQPTTTMTGAVGTTPTTAGRAEYAELCAVNQRILDRAAEVTPGTEDREFWESQRDDQALMVDLVPETLRADQTLLAEAWSEFVEVLSGYGYDSQAMMNTLGAEGYTDVFTPEVNAAGNRVQEFISATCGP